MNKFKWHQSEFNYLYFREEDGLLVGLCHPLGNQRDIFIAKVYKENADHLIGQYISMDFARKAVERYIDERSRTLLEER